MFETFLHLLTPHHTNNYRARLVQPVGLSVLLAIFLATQVWVRVLEITPVLPGGLVLGFASNITASQTVEQTNSKRAELGLAPLQVNGSLNQAAIAKANHMFGNNYWAHIAPDGTTPWVFIKNAGYRYAVAGENLARDFDTTGAMVNAWMDSPTHRENIVNPKYTEIGIAVVNGTLEGIETTLVVQMFGQPTQTMAQTSQAAATTDAPAPTTAQLIAEPTTPPSPTPALEPTTSPTPLVVAQIYPHSNPPSVEELTLGTTYSYPNSRSLGNIIISPLSITKSVTASIILLLVGILMYDLIYMSKHKLPRRVGKNWAHVTVLAFVLVFVIIVSQGKVL
jgi:hypothetical protein